MSEKHKPDRPEKRMEEERFNELYSAYATDVLRVSYFYLADRQKAEDVTQDVFVKLLTSDPDLEPGREKAWLLKVAVNRCRDLWRTSWAKRVVLGAPQLEIVPDPDSPERNLERSEVLRAVHALPAGFREVILLHYYQGLGVTEIAKMLGIAEGTVSSRLSRARLKLGQMLKEEE